MATVAAGGGVNHVDEDFDPALFSYHWGRPYAVAFERFCAHPTPCRLLALLRAIRNTVEPAP